VEIGKICSKHFEKPEQSRNIAPFVKRLKVMTTVNRFYHFVMKKIHGMCQKR